MNTIDKFMMSNKVVIITGGAGLLGKNHAEAVLDGKGIAVLLDINFKRLKEVKCELENKYLNSKVEIFQVDITSRESVEQIKMQVLEKYGKVDALINNAANNPKMEKSTENMKNIQFENFPIDIWMNDIAVGLTGALICSQVFGEEMAKNRSGVILNISSDLGVIAPDQRIYRNEDKTEEEQTIKPVTYSVIKHGLIGLTKYLATYWATKGVRANALCPAGVFNGQDEDFLGKLTNLIPMGRMADQEEYKGTVLYMLSDASSYMTGSTVIVDGGRTCW